VVLIAITNSQELAALDDDSTTPGSSFRFQVSQSFEELVDNVKESGSFSDAAARQNEKNMTRYNFFKYYKACSLDCDLVISV